MPIYDFPTSPTLNQPYPSSGTPLWKWNGNAWAPISSTVAAATGGDAFRYLGAGDFIPRTTNPCGFTVQETTTNAFNRDLLLFDPGNLEWAQAWFAWPTGWNTYSIKFFWKYSVGSGDCVWRGRVTLFADNTSVDPSLGALASVTDAGQGTGIHHESAATSAIAPSGTVSDGRNCVLEIGRDATNVSDTLNNDAELIGVLLTKAT